MLRTLHCRRFVKSIRAPILVAPKPSEETRPSLSRGGSSPAEKPRNFTRRRGFARACWLLMAALTGVFAACPFEPVAAQDRKLLVDPDDRPLEIEGVLEDGNTTFSRNVRLTVTGGDAQEVFLLAPDLRKEGDPSTLIDRSNVTIPSGVGLEENQPRDVLVTVNNVEKPGTYRGTLKFRLSDQPVESAERLDMTLEVVPTPDVVPLNQDLSFQLARFAKVGSLLEGVLLPRGMDKEMMIVLFDNQTPAEVPVTGAQLVLQGERTGFVLGTNEYQLEYPNNLPANEVSQVRVKVNRRALLPDRYKGVLRLKLEGLDDPVTPNLAMDVRDPPLWPLLIVALGVVIGRLAVKLAPPVAGAGRPAPAGSLTGILEFIAGTPSNAILAIPPGILRAGRALLFILLLVLLAFLGWQQLYIENGANFGVGGLLDYLGLFMWGLSADVVQRTLQRLR